MNYHTATFSYVIRKKKDTFAMEKYGEYHLIQVIKLSIVNS